MFDIGVTFVQSRDRGAYGGVERLKVFPDMSREVFWKKKKKKKSKQKGALAASDVNPMELFRALFANPDRADMVHVIGPAGIVSDAFCRVLVFHF